MTRRRRFKAIEDHVVESHDSVTRLRGTTLNKAEQTRRASLVHLSGVLAYSRKTMASTPIYLAFVAVCVVATSATATIYSFDDSRGVGRRFDGIGGLSGGGVSINLYKNTLTAS